MAEFERDFKGVWIEKSVWLDKRLNALDKVILAEIDSLDNGERGCYASNKHIANFCQCSETKVSTAISKLIDLGYLYVKHFDGRQRELKSCLSKSERQTYKNCEPAFKNLKESNIDNNTDINTINNNISVEFETLWKMYPRKVGKEAALRAYTKARNDKKDPTTFEQVKQGIENYIRQIEAKHTDTQYIKHGSSWFNARAWKDDYDFSPAKQFSSSPQLVTVNGKEYELRNGKYYTPDGCGIAIDPYAKSDLDDLF